MKKLLFICLWLISLSVFAQKIATPPTLTYRQSNTNELDMIVSSGGQLLTPSASLSITAEIRASDVGRIISTVSMSAVSSQDGTIRGILPDLQPNLYYLGLYVKRSGEPEYRVGVARIEILPTGSLRSITDASGLNVQINETKQVLDVKLDATPASSIAAYYAQQARAASDTVVTSVSTIHTYANSAQNSATSATSSAQSALNYKNLAQTSADSALLRATRAEAAKQSIVGSEQNALSSQTNAQLSADSANARALSALAYKSSAQVSADSALARTNRALTFKNSAGVSADSATARAARAGTFAANAALAKTGAETARDLAQGYSISAAQSASAAVAAFKGAWTANTPYATGDQVTQGGNTYRRKASGTSGSSFDPSNWDVVAQGGSAADGTITTIKLADASVSVAKLASDLGAVIVPGTNLIDKAVLLSGYIWSNSSGALITATGYKCYPTLIKLKTNTTYTISGANTDFLGGLYNSSGVRQSKLNTVVAGTRLTGITFTTGASDNYLGLNVSSVESTTPNAADNTIMLAEGTGTGYVSYVGLVVPGSRVQGVPNGAASTADLVPLTTLASSNSATISNIVAQSYNQYYSFDGTAYANLPVSYTLNAVGDFIDFYASSTSNASLPNQGLGLFGSTAGTFTNKLGFYSSTQIGLRGNASDPYSLWTVPGGFSDIRHYRIDVTAGGWRLTVDGSVIGTLSKPNPLIINNIGSSYSANFLGSLKSFTISTAASGTLVVNNVKAITGSVNVQEVLTKLVDNTTLAATLSPTYVSYNPTGSSTGNELLTIYVKYAPNSLYYAGYQVAHQKDSTQRQDVYRIYKADLYKYSVTGGMIAQGKALQTLGESESVYQISGASDATGGFHGDEKYTSIRLYVDGVPLSTTQLAGSFSLLPCSQFHYEQVANVYQTDNATDVVQCIHRKLTTFKDAGYTTTNNLTFTSTPPSTISIWYSGISCITLEQSGTFYSENLNYVSTDNQSTPKLNETGARSVRFYNATGKLSAHVTSTITKAKAGSTDNTSAYDNATLMVIYEQTGVRTKYYRELLNKSPISGEIWESTTTVKHFMEN